MKVDKVEAEELVRMPSGAVYSAIKKYKTGGQPPC